MIATVRPADLFPNTIFRSVILLHLVSPAAMGGLGGFRLPTMMQSAPPLSNRSVDAPRPTPRSQTWVDDMVSVSVSRKAPAGSCTMPPPAFWHESIAAWTAAVLSSAEAESP